MHSIVALWRNTKRMLQLLRMFCQGAMIAPPILAVLLLLPLADWTVNGRQIPYSELWSSGAGLTFLVFTLMATAGAWGLAARKTWARWALVASPVAPIIVATAFPRTWFTEQASGDLSIWLSALGTSALFNACLLLLPSVKANVSGRASADA